MVNLKGIFDSITSGLAKFVFQGSAETPAPQTQELALTPAVEEAKPLLLTSESNPELIQAVVTEMQNTDAHLLLEKMQDMEKALYHVAARQVQSMEHQKVLEEIIVSMATTLDEMLHGMSQTMDQQEESEEEALENAWDAKKSADHLN